MASGPVPRDKIVQFESFGNRVSLEPLDGPEELVNDQDRDGALPNQMSGGRTKDEFEDFPPSGCAGEDHVDFFVLGNGKNPIALLSFQFDDPDGHGMMSEKTDLLLDITERPITSDQNHRKILGYTAHGIDVEPERIFCGPATVVNEQNLPNFPFFSGKFGRFCSV